jgi:flavin reductase (DIM6/NTAB) family NADH-FMN oxidoreductase RutF
MAVAAAPEPVATPPGAGDAEIAEALRRVMRGVAATVTVVTTERHGVPYGMTATSFTSLALEPPTVLVAVNRAASLHAPLLARGGFAVNVLGEEGEAVARCFSDPALDCTKRFDRCAWRPHPSGPPLLAAAKAWLVCRLLDRLEVGTHTLIVGRVEAVANDERAAPLLYVDGGYRRLPEA